MENDVKKKIGERIRYFRTRKRISQEELSFRSELHRTYISDIERGVRNVSIVNIKKIASALGASVSELTKGL
jgi:transcriptional regulator with XRE-family HTH domain